MICKAIIGGMDIQKAIVILSEKLKLYHLIIKHFGTAYEVKMYEPAAYGKIEEEMLPFLREGTELLVIEMESDFREVKNVIQRIRIYGFAGAILLISKTEERPMQIEEKIEAIDAGADEYLGPSQTNEEIAASAKALLRWFDLKRSSLLTVSRKQFEIDPQMRKISMDGEEIAFTKTEYAILNYLLLHLNQAVSYKELYEAVWEKEYIHDDMNIMAHVHRIRKKMGDDTKNPRYIQNVYGIGYMIEGE